MFTPTLFIIMDTASSSNTVDDTPPLSPLPPKKRQKKQRKPGMTKYSPPADGYKPVLPACGVDRNSQPILLFPRVKTAKTVKRVESNHNVTFACAVHLFETLSTICRSRTL